MNLDDNFVHGPHWMQPLRDVIDVDPDYVIDQIENHELELDAEALAYMKSEGLL